MAVSCSKKITEKSWKTEENKYDLAEKITEARKKNGWSQEEMAEKLSVSRQAVSKWESAQSTPDVRSAPSC